jgi:hypothetical protein
MSCSGCVLGDFYAYLEKRNRGIAVVKLKNLIPLRLLLD